MASTPASQPPGGNVERAPRQPHRRTMLSTAMMAVGMLCLGFAAVPLYRMPCQATGLNGTTQRASGGVQELPYGHKISAASTRM